MRVTVAATLAGVLVMAGTASDASGGGEGRLQAAVEELHGYGITGVQGLTDVDGRVTTARAGVASLATGAPVPAGGYFRMGSNTKTFVSVVLLQLVGEGRLSLDDSVERWLPGVVTGNGNDGRKITVRELMQHTSGMADYTDGLPLLASADGFQAHRFDHYDAGGLVALAMRTPPLFAPGTSWSYSNTNYVLAGMIVGRVTGHSWALEVHDRILAPLHLDHTYVPDDEPALRDPHADSYTQAEAGGPLVDTTLYNPTAADAAGAMITTLADLARFWQALQGGRLLAPAQMAQMHETVPESGPAQVFPGARYGLGITSIPDSCGGYWAHAGGELGWTTLNGVSPDGKRVVVLSMSSQLADQAKEQSMRQLAQKLIDDTLCRR
ncbi:serine hydrolase domain-containing protein [Actinoplanes sp. URMC 104]|uniref:serine hydrolase domain-containing protein n=1 Tax=Actinoplanes sp. URMC 104 TaxID=3423409 RepID=UPI003F1B4E53